MTDRRNSRRALSIFVGVSCVAHALILFCVPVGPSGETIGERAIRQVKVQGIEFVKIIRPKPKPKPLVVQKPKHAPRVQPVRVRRARRIVRRAPRPERLEARVMPPPKPEETIAPPVEEPVPQLEAQPAESAKATPPPEPVTPPEPPPQPVETPEMVAMAPQPVPAGPRSTPTAVDKPLELGRRIETSEQPRAPSAPDLGNPEVTRPAPASGGDAKRTPQIGLQTGLENRSALPGTTDRLGAPESVAGPGGPIPQVISPNPGGSPRVAALPKSGSTGPIVRRGVPSGAVDAPSAPRGPSGPAGKRSPGPDVVRTVGMGPSPSPTPGSGESPGPAGPGQPIALITSPKSTIDAPPRGASGRDSGAGGGGGGDIVLAGGGGSDDFLAGGPGGSGAAGGQGGDKSRPTLGSPWGGDFGEPLYARGGSGGQGPGGSGGGGGGEGTGTGIGDGAGPGSGLGEPILVASAGPGGGYGYGNTGLPLGWPNGTETTGVPGYPWLKPGLGRAGGGGEGLFGGPHGQGSGGGFPGVGGKLTPGFGGVPGGTGLDIPPPFSAGDGGGGGGDQPGGPGLFGPLTVGGPGGGVGGPGGLAAFAKRGLGIPLLPSSIARPLLGIHGGLGGPGGSGAGTGAVGKGSPGGIYADLVGTFDIPVGVTNSDYNTDEVSVLNLLGVMRDRTNVRVTINNRYVPITYDAIKDAPMLWVSGHKPLTWTDEERAALKKYVENGGTLLIEDCHGPFNQVMPNEVRRIFGRELEPIPMDDELFRSFYVMDELPAGDVQERLPIRGLRMPDGRLGVIYSSNDYSDAWKVPRGSYVADEQKEQAYRMGINWYVYILANWRRGQAKSEATPRLPGMP